MICFTCSNYMRKCIKCCGISWIFIGLLILSLFLYFTFSYEFQFALTTMLLRRPYLGTDYGNTFIEYNNIQNNLPDLLNFSFQNIIINGTKDVIVNDIDDNWMLKTAEAQLGAMRSTGGYVICGGTADFHRRILQLYDYDTVEITIGHRGDDKTIHTFNLVRVNKKWVMHDAYFGYTLRYRDTGHYMDYQVYLELIQNNDLGNIYYDVLRERDHRLGWQQLHDYSYIRSEQKICNLTDICFNSGIPTPETHLLAAGDSDLVSGIERIKIIKNSYNEIDNILVKVILCMFAAVFGFLMICMLTYIYIRNYLHKKKRKEHDEIIADINSGIGNNSNNVV